MRQKKFRGNKRYYRSLQRRAEEFCLDLGPNAWYDHWHTHFDWHGRGNKKGKARSQHTRALFIAFENVLNQTTTYQKQYQTWLLFNASDSSQDAICFHTPNPNAQNFPYRFEGFRWGVSAPGFLRPYFKETYEIGMTEFEGKDWYAVRLKAST
jgi:hypothetical protein